MPNFINDLIQFKESINSVIELAKENKKKYKDISIYEHSQLCMEQLLGKIASLQSLIID